jgi:hypothetical protein
MAIECTPVEVTVGKDRGCVTFAGDNGGKFKMLMAADDARGFVDKLNERQVVVFADHGTDISAVEPQPEGLGIRGTV